MKAAFILILAAWCPVSAFAAQVSVTVNSNGGPVFTDSLGALLDAGSVVRVGSFDISSPANLATLQSSVSYAEVNALFTPLGEGIFHAGSVSQSGNTGSQLMINGLFSSGNIFGQITGIDSTYFTTGTLLYAWVFNSSNTFSATEWGIFGASTGWDFPAALGSTTLSTFEIDTTLRGMDTGTAFQLASVTLPVPEPAGAALVLLGLAVFLGLREKKAPQV